jgi:hypothetical protein
MMIASLCAECSVKVTARPRSKAMLFISLKKSFAAVAGPRTTMPA